MKSPTAKLGYTAAGMTVVVAMLVPFLLMGLFAKGFTKLGIARGRNVLRRAGGADNSSARLHD